MKDPSVPAPDRRALEADFDRDPGRFAANQLATQTFSLIGDIHDQVADRLAKITIGPILDLGGGNGSLAKLLSRQGRSTVVVDRADYVRSAPRPRYRPTLRGYRSALSVSLRSPLYGCCMTCTGLRTR
jgi:hypothetical protein